LCEKLDSGGKMKQRTLPQNGMQKQNIFKEFKAMKSEDAVWRTGRMFGLIYEAGEDVEALVKEAQAEFTIANGLNPMAFPSLVRMENEVVAMVISLTEGDSETVGSVTTGGTESILMALKAARDWGRSKKPAVTQPEIVIPVTAHPAWNKAAHYLNLKVVTVPVDKNFRADVPATEAAMNDNTIAIGGTAVTYPHGMMDPIAELGELALKHEVWLHVDACLGGLILPFLKKGGTRIPAYGFDVPGVSSVSADIHKYAYTPKGISVVMYRDASLRQYQFFVYADWPGGVYATPAMSGGRSGGLIAAAWAVFHYLGENGFVRLAAQAKQATDNLRAGIQAIPELTVLGDPEATVFAIASSKINIFELGARMNDRGWHIETQHLPPSLHMTVSPVHAKIVDQFLSDLNAVVPGIPPVNAETLSEQAALYAMIGTLPDRKMAHEVVLQFVNDIYCLKDR
jgi:glutamate/tyrosine decarboxylase-like PLP-dependent enzyme